MASSVCTVVPFPAPRGRPRKPRIEPKRCARSYDDVERDCREIPRRYLPALKERVSDRADRDRITPAERAALNFYLRRTNWDVGSDWHTNEHIAREKRMAVRSVERANRRLQDRGYIVRRPIPANSELPGFSRRRAGPVPWQTTLAVLVEEWTGMCVADRLSDPTEKCDPPIQSPTQNSPKARPKNARQTRPTSRANTTYETLPINTPPKPPQGRSVCVKWIDDLLERIRTPSRQAVISGLLEPLIRNREFRAPDPIAALSLLADQLSGTKPEILTATLTALLKSRADKVKSHDIATEVDHQTELERGLAATAEYHAHGLNTSKPRTRTP